MVLEGAPPISSFIHGKLPGHRHTHGFPSKKKKCVVGRVAKLHITARSEPGCILTEKKHGYLKGGTYDGWWGYISKCTGSIEEPNGKPLEFPKLSLPMPKRDTACKSVPVELAQIKR
ncbi:hypothetical protein EYR41_007005 [Orbilia oligospora]|uniref:Uncharacterized protein n=1 Tax=Orbilia oligospora TaxID=2813651 RepID=A0A7C8P7E8_ORBOL|nr:hypothetical protein TWF751_009401 [Orbilia oligospora]KAF3293908.1 hypothetical protein TWF132_003802 [Orbilia oligospora]TGJ67909.1 hypothetical protein EYR41_007005 [Orbilia oligospora]